MATMDFFGILAGYVQILIIEGGYGILFAVTVIEGLPLIGLVIPGHITIVASGFLAKIGIFSLAKVVSIAIAGAVIGDCAGFYLGRRYGMSLIDRLGRHFLINPSHLAKAQALLNRHTGKAMILGRFSPVTRALMPFLVGANRLPALKFWFFNIIGAIFWVLVSVMVGYLFGAGYMVAAEYLGKFVFIAIVSIILIVWGYRFVNARFHLFAKYELLILILNIISLIILAKAVQDVWEAPSLMSNFDLWLNAFWSQNAVPFLVNIAYWVSTTGDTLVFALVGLLIGGWLAIRRHPRMAAVMLLSMGSVGVVVGLLKEFFARIRPENIYALADHSFPSGHAAFSAAFFFALAYIFAPRIHNWVKRELFIVCCVLAFLVVGLSRVILDVHWASDVVAGWALGIFIATGSVLFVRYMGALIVGKGK